MGYPACDDRIDHAFLGANHQDKPVIPVFRNETVLTIAPSPRERDTSAGLEKRKVRGVSTCHGVATHKAVPLVSHARIAEAGGRVRVVVANGNAGKIEVRTVSTSAGVALRFDVSPIDSEYTIGR